MASNIASNASFATQNMKPASGENIDALWGQNVSDNTGYLRARAMPFLNGYGTEGVRTDSSTNPFSNGLSYRVHILRIGGHNRLIGTYVGAGTFGQGGSPDCRGTHGPYFYGDLGTYGGTSTFATTNIGADYTFGSTFAFSLDLDSYLSEGAWGTLVCFFSGTSDDGGASSRHIQYNVGTPCKTYTSWV